MTTHPDENARWPSPCIACGRCFTCEPGCPCAFAIDSEERDEGIALAYGLDESDDGGQIEEAAIDVWAEEHASE
jgi:MinD superfamily P-loop ATPase